MNEVLSQLHARKSVRAFLDRPISPEARRAILEAACAAPTAGNQQLYTILDITDQAVKDTLADTCDHQPFIAQAPLVLLFCADCQKWYDAFAAGGCSPRRPGPGDLWLALSDANIAAQNAVTAAWSLGIGSCYIGDILEQVETHRTLLRLPEYVVPAALLVFGYPTQQQQEREKPRRRALEHIVHENAYRRMEPAELEAMLADNAGARPYGQQVMSPDGELCHTRALRARMSSTGSPYRATRVALTIMRNASASTISGSARSIATGLPAPWYSPFAAEKSA